MKRIPATRTRGRPRAFDADKALEKAMRVFWKNGYEGASLEDLTAAMGINRPSMYATFGNKEALFRKALDRYVEKSGPLLQEALAEPTARATVERLLNGIVDYAGPGKIRGCLLVQGALACGDSADPIRDELALRRAAGETALRQRFERAIAQRDLPRGSDPAALAKYVTTFQHGLAVQLAGGASRDELLAAVEVAMRAWPR
jgi:AcrR family transcriptional regulator